MTKKDGIDLVIAAFIFMVLAWYPRTFVDEYFWIGFIIGAYAESWLRRWLA